MMKKNKLPIWPNERTVDRTYENIDSIIWQGKADIAQNIAGSREWLEVKITKEKIVAGLKYIAEHQDMYAFEILDDLIALGCDFTLDDVYKQFPKDGELFQFMKEGYLWSGAYVIVQFMSWGYESSFVKDRFFSTDDDTSVYAFIRKVTGDNTYTKEYVDSLAKKRK